MFEDNKLQLLTTISKGNEGNSALAVRQFLVPLKGFRNWNPCPRNTERYENSGL
jgi:hypothetical protein